MSARAQAAASAALLSTTWAHFRPGMFHAFDADVAVTVCAAVASDSEAYGMWCAPGCTSGAWISSENTRPPLRSTTSATASSSSRSSTRPVGLCGFTRTSRWPPARNARSIPSRSRAARPPAADPVSIGTWITSRPQTPGAVTKGMYAGVGRITGEPGRENWSIVIRSASRTSPTGWTRAGSTCHP